MNNDLKCKMLGELYRLFYLKDYIIFFSVNCLKTHNNWFNFFNIIIGLFFRYVL